MPTDGHQPDLWRWAPPREQGSGDMCPVDIMVKLDFGQLYPGHRCLNGLYSSQFDLRRSYHDSEQMYLSQLYLDQLYLEQLYLDEMYLS